MKLFIAVLILILIPNNTFSQTWETLSNIPEKLSFPVVTVLQGKIHVIGGGAASGATNVHYRYDPKTDKWDTLAPVPYKAQQPAGATVAGKIHYFGGGYPNSGTPVASHYSYHLESNSWKKETNLTAARAIHYAIDLNDTLYSMGGQGMKNLFEAYDTNSKKWIGRTNLPDDNFWYGAHISTHGKIFRFGGGGFSSPKLEAHEYNPKTKQWVALPDLPERSHAISGSALGNIIYLAGGYALSTESDKVWLYDINLQTYTAGVKLPQARNYHKLVTIDNCIYSVGGNNSTNSNMALSLIRFCPIDLGQNNILKESIIIKVMQHQILVELTHENSNCKVFITDMVGNIIETNINNQSQNIIYNTRHLAKGIYIVNVLGHKKSYSKKIVIAE